MQVGLINVSKSRGPNEPTTYLSARCMFPPLGVGEPQYDGLLRRRGKLRLHRMSGELELRLVGQGKRWVTGAIRMSRGWCVQETTAERTMVAYRHGREHGTRRGEW
jgi:hypothetical protein